MSRKTPSRAGRIGMTVGALIMLLIGAAYGVTHASEPLRRAGWTGEPGRLTVLGCDRERSSRGGITYQCYGDFVADDRSAGPNKVQAQFDDTTASAYHLGQVLTVTFNGRSTVSPVGFGYVLHALMALVFLCVAVPGIGVLLAGEALEQSEGRWSRVSERTSRTGLLMFGGGSVLALILGLISLF